MKMAFTYAAISLSSHDNNYDLIKTQNLSSHNLQTTNTKSSLAKSRSFAGLFFAALLMLGLLAFNNKAMAQVTITAPSLTVTACTTFPTASFTLGNIVIAENADNNISTFGTLILSAPTNFQFTNAGTATFTPGQDILSVSVSLTNATTITLTITPPGSGNITNDRDAITISGIQVIGITSATAASNVTRTGGTSVIAGDANGAIHATLTSVVGTASVGGTIAGSATVCTGTNSTGFTLSGHTGSITRWEWSLSSTFASGINTVANATTSLTVTNLTATTYYRAVITSGACPLAYSATGTVTVDPASVGGTIAGSATVCTGTNSTGFTLSGHTGSITRWEWSLSSTFASGINTVANTTTSLTATNLTATTYYRAVITSGACPLTYSATGTVTVSPASVGGTVSGSATVCTGTNSTVLTLSGHTGSITRWEYSSASDFSAGLTTEVNTTTTLTATNLTATRYYRAVITSGACASAYSSTGTVTVISSNTVNLTSGVGTNAQTVCISTPITDITYATTGATGATFSGLPTGVTGSWSANVVTITGTPSVSGGAATYTVTLTGGCGSVNATGTIIVSPASVGGTIAGSATVCSGINSTGLTLSGHTGSITRWEYSSASDFSAGLTPVVNTTTSLTAINLTATTYYRAVITSGACALAYSSTGTVTVNPASVGGTLAGSATVCTGTNSTVFTLSGHTGSITRWEWSLSSTFASGINTVANITTTLTATNLTATTYYRAVITSGACALAYSATGIVTVSPASVGGTLAGSATFCTGTNSTVFTLSGHTGSITRWEYSSASDFSAGLTTETNTTTTLTATNIAATTYYRAVITSGACALAYSATGTITVLGSIPANPITSATAGSICSAVGIPVTVNSSTLSSGIYSIAYDFLSATNVFISTGTPASMTFNQGTGTGTFTTSNPGAGVKVRITQISIGGCTPVSQTVITNQIVNQVPGVSGANGFTMTGSTTDSNNPFGATISVNARGGDFSTGTYRLTYAINTVPVTVPINGTAIVQFTAGAKKNTFVTTFTTGQLPQGNYTISVSTVSYFPSTGCSFNAGASTSFVILAGGLTITTVRPGTYSDGLTVWGFAGSGPDGNGGTIIIDHDVVIDGTLFQAPDILVLNQLIINATLTINANEILQITNDLGVPGFDIILGTNGRIIVMQNTTIGPDPVPGGTLIFSNGVTHQGMDIATKVTFNNGSIYRHQATNTEGSPPIATWFPTSNFIVEGYTSYSTAFASSNWSQNFGNFTWNCLNQVTDVNLNSRLGLTPATSGNLQGNVSIQSTGSGSGRLKFGDVANYYLTIAGDLNASNAARFTFGDPGGNGPNMFLTVNNLIYGSSASSWLCEGGNNTVNILGSLQVNSGTLYLSSGANNKTGSTVTINRNLTVVGTLDASDTQNDRLGRITFNNLASPTEHLFNNTGLIRGHILWTIAGNQFVRAVDLSPFVSARASLDAFTLAAGAKLIVESTNANGALQSVTALPTAVGGNMQILNTGRTFVSGSTIEFNRTTPQAQFISGTGHPTTAGVNCIINNTSGVTVTSAGGTVTISGNLFVNNGNLTATENNLTVQGNLQTNNASKVIINTKTLSVNPTILTVNGAIDLNGGAIDFNSSASQNNGNTELNINGDLQGTAFFAFSGNNCQVTIGGTTPTTFSRVFPISGATTLEQLRINRVGATLVVSQPLTVGNKTGPTYSGGVFLSQGNLRMTSSLTVTTVAALGSVSTISPYDCLGAGVLYFEGQTVELQRNIFTCPNGVFYSSSASILNITTDFGGVANTLAFSSPLGNTLGTLTLNRSDNATPNVSLNSALTISGNMNLTDGEFFNQSGLAMGNGANINRTGQAAFATLSVVPTGGPYNVVYNDYTNNPPSFINPTVQSLSSGIEIQGIQLQNVTSNLTGTATLTTSLSGTGTLTVNKGVFDCVTFPVVMNAVSIASSATLTAPTGNMLTPTDNTLTLTGTGSFTNNGIFNSGSGTSTVVFNGNTTISGTSTTTAAVLKTTFNHVTLNASSTLTAPELIQVKGDISLGNGSTFNHSRGNVEFTGSDDHVITANNTLVLLTQDLSMNDTDAANNSHFWDITMSGSGNVSLNTDLRLGHLLDIQSGAAFTSNGRLILLSQNASTHLDASIGPILNGGNVVGAVQVQRFMGEVTNALFRYISSPVQNGAIPSVINKILRYNTATGTWVKDFSVMSTGVGYTTLTYNPVATRWSVTNDIKIGPHYYPGPDPTSTFLVPGWYLIGNPYPSAIQWRNPSNVIDPTDGWDYNDVNKIATIMAITDNTIAGYPNYFHYYDYNNADNPGWGTSPVKGSGTIAMGQSYWVYALAGGSITIKEPAKKSAANFNTAGQFYRQGGDGGSEQRLSISVDNGVMADQSFLIVNPKATNGFDFNLDFPKLWNQEMNVFLVDKTQTDMLMLALAEMQDDISIPVGVKVTKPGEYHMSIGIQGTSDKLSGLFLVDKLEGVAMPASSTETYTFTITDVSKPVTDRFYLTFNPDVELAKDTKVTIFPNPVKDQLQFEVYGANQNSSVTLMDVNGKIFASTDFKGKGTIDMVKYQAGLYILKIKTDKGLVTRKIIKID